MRTKQGGGLAGCVLHATHAEHACGTWQNTLSSSRGCWIKGAAALHPHNPSQNQFVLQTTLGTPGAWFTTIFFLIRPRIIFQSYSQEEVGELKAEIRKLVSDAKNVERRISVGVSRGVVSERAFGLKPKGTDGDGVVPGGKGPPHTPSKKLSDAKNR